MRGRIFTFLIDISISIRIYGWNIFPFIFQLLIAHCLIDLGFIIVSVPVYTFNLVFMIDTSTVFGKVCEFLRCDKYPMIINYISNITNYLSNNDFVSDFYTAVCNSALPAECRDAMCFSVYDSSNNNRAISCSMSSNIL